MVKLLPVLLSGGGGNTSDARSHVATAFQLPTTTTVISKTAAGVLLKAGLRDLTDPYFDNSNNNNNGEYYPDYGVIDMNNRSNINNNGGVNRLFDGIRNDN
jgi:hypothetical protein